MKHPFRFLAANWILIVSVLVLAGLVLPTVYLASILRPPALSSIRETPADTTAASGSDKRKPLIGISLNSLTESRWLREKELFQQAAEQVGADLVIRFAHNNPARQADQIRRLIQWGVDGLIVVPPDTYSLKFVLEEVKSRGIPIVSYDSLTEGPVDLYVGFDYREVGRLQASRLLRTVKHGNILIVVGHQKDYRTHQLLQGYKDVLDWPDLPRGIRLLGTEFAANGSAAEAVTRVSNVLAHTSIAGILTATDLMAEAVVEFLQSQGLPIMPVTGSGAELQALERIINDEQLMTVLQDFRESTFLAISAAVLLAQTHPEERTSSAPILQTLGVLKPPPLQTVTYNGRSIAGFILPVLELTKNSLPHGRLPGMDLSANDELQANL